MKARLVNSVLRVASVAVIPLSVVALSAPASAQRSVQRPLFEWRGNVDQEIRVQMQGSRAAVMAMGPREMTGYNNARAVSALPSVNGYVTVQMRQGRGRADVVEQPTARNGYTTVIRIRDTQSGAGAYDVAAFWQPNGNVAYSNGVYGAYGDDGQYRNYGQYRRNQNYSRYNTYPRTVIVQQPVYPTRSRYPDRVTPNGGYQSGHAQPGKTLPATSSQPSQPGKTLPGTDRSDSQSHAWPRRY